jgi:hypothetical protein
MKCSDIQYYLALYADQKAEGQGVRDHITSCPLCRQRRAGYREMQRALGRMRRPNISSALGETLKAAVRSEIRSQKGSLLPIAPYFREWLKMSVMPYGVATLASLAVAVTFLAVMFSGMLAPSNVQVARINAESSVLLANNSDQFRNRDPMAISAPDFARSRLGLGTESPSINPQGALVALTRSLVRGGMKDDEVVVVADVFGNGLAQIAEVIEPSHDRKAVGELEKALESDPAFSPFVPSNIEHRPESVRVILKFRSVDVSTRDHRRK